MKIIALVTCSVCCAIIERLWCEGTPGNGTLGVSLSGGVDTRLERKDTVFVSKQLVAVNLIAFSHIMA